MTKQNAAALPIGKLPNALLEKIIQGSYQRSELISGPGVGEDCAVLDLDSMLLVVSTDPITGTDADLGSLGVHVAMNDLGAAGAEPVAMLVTLLCPPGTTEASIAEVMRQVHAAAEKLSVAIAGGHTEITDAVTRMVLSIAAIGKAKKGQVVSTRGAMPGDSLFMTKAAGLEGTAILSRVYAKDLLKQYGDEWLQRAIHALEDISVVAEGRSAGAFGVHAMHDVTEGGVLGAVWEMCHAAGLGCTIEHEKIPIRLETLQLCAWCGIDPLKLISSGSLLIACSKPDEFSGYMQDLGHPVTCIGKLTKNPEKMLISQDQVIMVLPPDADELYKALKR